MRLNVFLNAYGKRHFVGILEEQAPRIFFEYSPEFIATGINLSPFMLPLKSQIFEDTKQTFDGLFGVFNDSLPDGWGCLLLDRQLQKKGLSLQQITPLQRLSMIGLNAMGALEYEPITENDSEFVGDIELDSLCLEANHILAGKSSEVLDKLLTLNGSSGGARPKIVALVSDDKQTLIHGNLAKPGYSPWLIKFASSLDNKNIGAEEYVYSKMAKDAGIEMPETHLFPSKNCVGHFGVKRFDRIGSQKPPKNTFEPVFEDPCHRQAFDAGIDQRHKDVVHNPMRQLKSTRCKRKQQKFRQNATDRYQHPTDQCGNGIHNNGHNGRLTPRGFPKKSDSKEFHHQAQHNDIPAIYLGLYIQGGPNHIG